MSNNDILHGFDEGCGDYLKVEHQKVDGVNNCLALKLKGQIDAHSAQFIERNSKKAIQAGFIHLLFVLDEVNQLSSAGIETFLKIQKEAKGRGGDVSMVDSPKAQGNL
jgi:anti-anti-sigma factor